FESRSSRGNRRDKFFKPLLDGKSRKPEKIILKSNSNQQKEITSIGTLCKGNQSSKRSSTSCGEIKKSSTSVHLIIFTLFVTIYFGRVYAVFLTSLWVLLFSLVSKSICTTFDSPRSQYQYFGCSNRYKYNKSGYNRAAYF
ncbi:hypothetical protein HAX54_029178, partial [Datura stramonium]|nr:hypothetical protein [Datura stramonium]